MIHVQNKMHEHANCLEQVLNILKDSTGLLNICPYSSLINITPMDEDFFTYIHSSHPRDTYSEIVPVKAELPLKRLGSNQAARMKDNSNVESKILSAAD